MINKLFNYAKYDGCKHIIISAILTAVLSLFVSWAIACVVVFAIGVLKEVYDRITGKGYAEAKDIVCDIIGIIIGAL